MKKIALNGAAADNAGNFCDGGAELEVSNSAKPGHIDEERAKALVRSGGAHVIATAAKAKKPATKKAAPKRTAKKAPAPAAAPPPPPPVELPPAS